MKDAQNSATAKTSFYRDIIKEHPEFWELLINKAKQCRLRVTFTVIPEDDPLNIPMTSLSYEMRAHRADRVATEIAETLKACMDYDDRLETAESLIKFAENQTMETQYTRDDDGVLKTIMASTLTEEDLDKILKEAGIEIPKLAPRPEYVFTGPIVRNTRKEYAVFDAICGSTVTDFLKNYYPSILDGLHTKAGEPAETENDLKKSETKKMLAILYLLSEKDDPRPFTSVKRVCIERLRELDYPESKLEHLNQLRFDEWETEQAEVWLGWAQHDAKPPREYTSKQKRFLLAVAQLQARNQRISKMAADMMREAGFTDEEVKRLAEGIMTEAELKAAREYNGGENHG